MKLSGTAGLFLAIIRIMEQLDKTVKEYIAYVEEMVSNYRKIGDLVDNASDTITPQKINTALSQYYNMSLAICAEYQRQKIQYEALKLEFDIWQDTIFEEAKRQVLAEYSETKIKPSVKEFETRARMNHLEEYKEKNFELTRAESRMRFMLRMLDTINKYDNILTAISYNMRSEMKALSLDDRMNASIDGVRNNKVRSFGSVRRRVVEDED